MINHYKTTTLSLKPSTRGSSEMSVQMCKESRQFVVLVNEPQW